MTIVAGNWKMHLGPEAAHAFADEFSTAPGANDATDATVLLFPPALSLAALRAHSIADRVGLGVQHLHSEPQGAFTGELSAEMAVEAGATWALVGHSERRHIFGETDAQVAERVRACLRAGLQPMVCVGETLEQRRAGRLEEVLARQLEAALAEIGGAEGTDGSKPYWALAYEPVWAIGTGETATPDDAGAAHTFLSEQVLMRGLPVPPILYGGSVKPDNAAELMAVPSVNGVLVGGASLAADSFASIVGAAPTR